jgi:hypothetical protein
VTGENGRDQDLDPVVADQVDYIVSAFGERGTAIGVVATEGGVSYMYAEGHLVVREEHLGRVQQMLPQPCTAQRVAQGVMLVRMDEDAPGGRQTVPDLLLRIDAELGEGIATPNHVITVAPVYAPCPATEPQEVYDGIEPSPSVDVDNGGAGVLVYVADTGLLDGAATTASWLGGVQGDPDPLPKPLPDGTQPIPPYAGHGTFVAGVIRCVAPQADIYVGNVFNVAGSALETDFVCKLDAALDLGADIFNLSITAPTRNDLPLVAFGGWLKRARQYKGVVSQPLPREWSPSARSRPTGAAAPTSATTVAGSTCTRQAGHSSTPTPPAPTPAASRRTWGRSVSSTAWPGGAAPPSPRPS